MRQLRSDSGAAAVEFALVLFPLMLILMGIIDFGRVYSQQLTILSAARQGARVAAVQNDGSAKAATIAAATGLSPPLNPSNVTLCYDQDCTPAGLCSVGATVTVRITYPTKSITGMFPVLDGRNIIETAVMRCGG